MALQLADLVSEERSGSIDEFPIAQYLGDKTEKDCYIFIKEAEALKAGWNGKIEDEHVFNDGNTEKGVILQSACFQVIRVSGRYVQTRTPDKDGVKRVTVHGNYDDANAQKRMAAIELYRKLKADFAEDRNSQVSLRTLFLCIFLDPKTKKPLHSIPIIVSTAGQAPIQLNNALNTYKSAWTAALCEASKVAYSPRDEETNALCIYDFKFVPYQAQSADGTESRFIAAPVFDGSAITAKAIASITALDRNEETLSWFKASDGFADTYFAASMASSPYLAQSPFADLPAIPGSINGDDALTLPGVAVQNPGVAHPDVATQEIPF